MNAQLAALRGIGLEFSYAWTAAPPCEAPQPWRRACGRPGHACRLCTTN